MTRGSRAMFARLARRMHVRGEDDRGSILIWFVVTAPVIILLAILIVDGGAKVNAGEKAAAGSAQAARAATLAVGPYGGPGSAQAAVNAADTYLNSAGLNGSTKVTGPATVEVSVTVSVTGPIVVSPASLWPTSVTVNAASSLTMVSS